jgi:putative glutamine amidotransferase
MRPRIGITSAPTLYLERRVDRVSRWYVDAVLGAGGLPLILPTMAPDDAEEVLAGLDGLLLTGGGDVAPWCYGQPAAPEVYDVDPARDAWEMALARAAVAIPILGVCRGEQLLNVAAGGSLIQHLPDVTTESHRLRDRDQEPVHDVDIEPGSQLAAITGRGRLGVNSIHHQAVDRIGEGFQAVAWAPDGIVEAIERTDGAPVVAIQWHPESLTYLAPHNQLFLWLTQTAARRRPHLQVPESFEGPAAGTGGRGHLVDDPA